MRKKRNSCLHYNADISFEFEFEFVFVFVFDFVFDFAFTPTNREAPHYNE
jgi:hypothetical protein